MIIPETIWDLALEPGVSLRDRVKGSDPHVQSMKHGNFLELWRQRQIDARNSGNAEYIHSSQKIVEFLEQYKVPEISLLIWPEAKIRILFAAERGAAMLCD